MAVVNKVVNKVVYPTVKDVMNFSGASYPSIIDDGNTVAWYDAAAAYVIKDVSDRVSQMTDRTGLGHHLVQLTGADQMLWSATGVLGDGVSEFMKTATFTFEQPEMIYMVVKQVSWANVDRLVDGDVNDSMLIYQNSSTPKLDVSAGTPSAHNSNLAVGDWGIIRVLFNGANSTFQINETVALTGDYGASDANGFTLASRNSGSNVANIEVKEIIARKSADTATDQDIIYNYLKTKYGL